ncbi:unnamed protein product [Adineta steineri]|uniref:NADP-dependent oxidoreductase domain-containing protein n=1 Tax=Adineta steineri TaxID=433720 RepID=A0A814IB49_9BILA|nr:unnamed protein product [Adineta steineri]
MTAILSRQLGKNGPQVSSIGFGAMGLSAFYGAIASDEERFKVLDRVIELGSTYIDSADRYGDNEDLLGKYFKKYPQQREKVFLATKFAIVVLPDGTRAVRGDAQYVHEQCNKSLQRLGLDYIDLYYVHRIDKNTPIEETMGALKELVQEGKIKQIGLSECSSDTLRRAYAVHPVAAVQIEYSPFMDTLSSIAKKKNCTTSQLTLAWIHAQGEDFFVIPGTTKIKNLEENVGAAGVKLSKEEEQEIRQACENADIVGGRYPESLSASLFGDSAPKKA